MHVQSSPAARRAMVAIAANSVLAASAAAEASFVPGVSPETPTGSAVDGLVIPAIVVAVAVLGFIVLQRSAPGRVGAGIILAVFAFLIGGVFVLAGLFGDLSGQHQVLVVALALGLVVMAGALFAMVRLWSSRTRGATGSPPPGSLPPLSPPPGSPPPG